jgi:hypothetical protein
MTHQEDEKDTKVQGRSVVRAEICCLDGSFADQTDEDARQSNEHESTASKSFYEKCTEDIAGEGRQHPEGAQEEWPKSRHAELSVQDDSIVGNTIPC